MSNTKNQSSKPMDRIRAKINGDEVVWLDAGNGTELQARGAAMHPDVWCGVAHVENPQIMQQIHFDYINAGADIITTNTFSCNRNMMGPAGLGDQVPESVTTGVTLAKQARVQAGAEDRVAIAGSMSHQIPVIKGTSKRIAEAAPRADVAIANFSEMAGLLKNAGVDLILLEMMSDPALVIHAQAAAKKTGLPVWMGTCCKRAESGQLTNYTVPEISFDETCEQLLDTDLDVVGIMHTNIDYIDEAITTIRRYWDGPIMAYPDSGHFTMPDWQFESVIQPQAYAVRVQKWVDNGVNVIGACCGMGVDHLQACTGGVTRSVTRN